MDPTIIFCPNEHCPARGQTGHGNIGIHSRKEQRFICHECDKTFSARRGTVFYRLRTSAETVVLGRPCSPMGVLCKRSWRLLALTSGPSLIGGHAPVAKGRRCRSSWSNDRGTWGRCKPTSSASRSRAASCGWRWP